MKYADEWIQHNDNWESIGYPAETYVNWLEEQVTHWRQCALAASEPS